MIRLIIIVALGIVFAEIILALLPIIIVGAVVLCAAAIGH